MGQVTDPVCGMRIDPAMAAGTVVRPGGVVYFCSAECQQKFEANPAEYELHDTAGTVGDGPPLERHEPPYTTTGKISAPKFGSAGSGGLEYELLPEAHGDGDGSKG